MDICKTATVIKLLAVSKMLEMVAVGRKRGYLTECEQKNRIRKKKSQSQGLAFYDGEIMNYFLTASLTSLTASLAAAAAEPAAAAASLAAEPAAWAAEPAAEAAA